jgi:exoribonuclease-2
MVFDAAGVLTQSTLYRALVRNQAKLAYDAVSAWIEGGAELPAAAAAVPGMAAQLQLQDAMAQRLRALRHAQGSLEFESSQPRAVFEGAQVVDLQQQVHNRARQLIEEFMIATNGCTARYLNSHGQASLRRVVRSPERWQRIVTVAQERGHTLPADPDAKALSYFLAKQHRKDPLHFQDLSLIIVKLLGSGEYTVESPQMEPVGHFGLAVRDYTHSTAPNRRYPDLITARLLKAVLKGEPSPYAKGELEMLAQHCTVQEDAAQKVERQMRKSDAAMLLESHVGQRFEALVTGSTPSGMWVRIFSPPAEGKLVDGQEGLNVGDALRVKLIGTNVERGFIDFVRVG